MPLDLKMREIDEMIGKLWGFWCTSCCAHIKTWPMANSKCKTLDGCWMYFSVFECNHTWPFISLTLTKHKVKLEPDLDATWKAPKFSFEK
jgi:hypothetical protein